MRGLLVKEKIQKRMVVNVRKLFSLFQSLAFQFVAGTECAISGLLA